MEQSNKISNIIYHISRLGIDCKANDLKTFLKRNLKTIGSHDKSLQKQLSDILNNAPTTTFLRNKNLSIPPVDRDSRAQLLTIESPPLDLNVTPIWDKMVFSQLNQIIQERENRNKFHDIGLDISKAAIFYGPPGVGKSLAAKWLANKLNLPLLTLNLSSVISSFLGKTGNNVRDVFHYAQGMPCILFLDELDSIAKKRDDNTEIGELKRIVTVLLQAIDNWDSNSLLIAATNHPQLLDPAVWRRFDIELNFPLPNEEIIRDLISKFSGEDINKIKGIMNELVVLFKDFSFSDIKREIDLARRYSIINNIHVSEALLTRRLSNLKELPKKDKYALAKHFLNNCTYSQRKVSELFGISRTTLRDIIKN